MQKGAYRGEILGSSKWHVVQRVGNSQTAVAHLKNQLEHTSCVRCGRDHAIRRERARLRRLRNGERRHAHGKELTLRR